MYRALECDTVYSAVNKYMERNSGKLFPHCLILPLLDVYVVLQKENGKIIDGVLF